jgi:hypothetical protein
MPVTQKTNEKPTISYCTFCSCSLFNGGNLRNKNFSVMSNLPLFFAAIIVALAVLLAMAYAAMDDHDEK